MGQQVPLVCPRSLFKVNFETIHGFQCEQSTYSSIILRDSHCSSSVHASSLKSSHSEISSRFMHAGAMMSPKT